MFEKLAHRHELRNAPNGAWWGATIESEMRSVTGGLLTISHLSFGYISPSALGQRDLALSISCRGWFKIQIPGL